MFRSKQLVSLVRANGGATWVSAHFGCEMKCQQNKQYQLEPADPAVQNQRMRAAENFEISQLTMFQHVGTKSCPTFLSSCYTHITTTAANTPLALSLPSGCDMTVTYYGCGDKTLCNGIGDPNSKASCSACSEDLCNRASTIAQLHKMIWLFCVPVLALIY